MGGSGGAVDRVYHSLAKLREFLRKIQRRAHIVAVTIPPSIGAPAYLAAFDKTSAVGDIDIAWAICNGVTCVSPCPMEDWRYVFNNFRPCVAFI